MTIEEVVPTAKALFELGFGFISFSALLAFMYWYITKLSPRIDNMERIIGTLVSNNTKSTDAIVKNIEAVTDVLHKVSGVMMVHDEKVAGIRVEANKLTGHMEQVQQCMVDKKTIDRIHERIDEALSDIVTKADIQLIHTILTEVAKEITQINVKVR